MKDESNIEVRLPYSQYEGMKKTIEEQANLIKELQDKNNNVILLDRRWGSSFNGYIETPCFAKGEEKVKEILKEEFRIFKEQSDGFMRELYQARQKNKNRWPW